MTRYAVAPNVVAEMCDDCQLRTLDPSCWPLREILASPDRDVSDLDDEGRGRHVLTHDEYVEACGGIDRAHGGA